MSNYSSSCTINDITCTTTVSFLETVFMEKRLPIIMQNNDFWDQLMQACNKDISLAIEEIKDKSELFVIDKMEYARLLEIVDLLNIPFDASLDSTVEFLRREVAAIPFKLAYKSTAILYKSFYRAINKPGQVYIYYYNGANIIKSTKSLLLNSNTIVKSEPWTHLSEEDFSGFLEFDRTLDSNERLDTGWSLDTKLSKSTTKHVGIEYIAEHLLTHSNGNQYVMIDSYLQYLKASLELFRRVVEVGHVGVQINALTDSTGNVNEVIDIATKTLTTSNFNESTFINDVLYMKFGINKKTDISIVEPTDMGTVIATKTLDLNDELYSNTNYVGCTTEYQAQYITEDTITSLATPKQLTYYPVKKKSIRFSFTYQFQTYTLNDISGKLYQEFPDGTTISGTCNYTTGILTFTDYPAGITDMEITYYTTQTININEVGLYDANDNLLAYSTFPNVEFTENYFHLTFGFVIKRTAFS